MDYTVKQLASLAGVSVRTLHHYDKTGLLKPARIGENRYRYYGPDELMRLQHILFFRELGFGLREISILLDSDSFDTLRALRLHGRKLQQRREKLEMLQRTIERTIKHLQGEIAMNHEELFKGFSEENRDEHRRALIEYYGDEAADKIDESFERTKDWTPQDYEEHKQKMDGINRRFSRALEQGSAPGSEVALKLVGELHEYVNQFWSADKEAFKAMGTMYVENPDFRATYDAWHPELAHYVRDAIHTWCDKQG